MATPDSKDDFDATWQAGANPDDAAPAAEEPAHDEPADALADTPGDATTVEVPPSRREQIRQERERQAQRLVDLEAKTSRLDELEREVVALRRERERPAPAPRAPERREEEDEDARLDPATELKLQRISEKRWAALKSGDHAEWDRLGRQEVAVASAAQAKRFAAAAPAAATGNPAMEMVQSEFSDLYAYADKNNISREDLVAHLRHFDRDIARKEGLSGPALWRKAHEETAKHLGVRKVPAPAPSERERAAHSGAPAPRNGGGAPAGSNGNGRGAIRVDLAAAGLGTMADVRKAADRSFKHLPPEKRVARYLQHYANMHPEHVLK